MQKIELTHRKRQCGMTLLELTAVVATIGMLATFAVPAFNGYLDRARTAQAIGDIGTITLQLHRYKLATKRFPVTLAEAGIDATDPWGRPYVYTPVAGTSDDELRKDRHAQPINTDFDLYSLGPDGRSAKPLTADDSRDDIIRTSIGAYVGVASGW